MLSTKFTKTESWETVDYTQPVLVLSGPKGREAKSILALFEIWNVRTDQMRVSILSSALTTVPARTLTNSARLNEDTNIRDSTGTLASEHPLR